MAENKEEQKIEENKEDEVVELKKTIETQKIQLEEQEDRLKRVAAEFENYKKRSTKERETLYNYLKGDVILTILPVVDNLEKAVVAKTEDESYKQGIELVLKQLKDVLTSNGVKEIETTGQYQMAENEYKSTKNIGRALEEVSKDLIHIK